MELDNTFYDDDSEQESSNDEVTEPRITSELRWLADQYEQAQRVRVETGERIRAVIHGRDTQFKLDNPITVPEGEEIDADAILKQIIKKATYGPVTILGRTYQRMHDQERDTFKEMDAALRSHPAFPWLSRVRGIGPTLACKLLARLDINKAQYASSFWAYCGLATEPGKLYRCTECGIERSFPIGFKITGAHKRRGSITSACSGKLEAVTIDVEIRVAQVHARKGEKATYDAYAKKILFLVGTSFLKQKGPYEAQYRKARERLDKERPFWADGRRHLTALRITNKLFLAHLWEVWRKADGLPTPTPWIVAHAGHDPSSIIDPWTMVEPPKEKKTKKKKETLATHDIH